MTLKQIIEEERGSFEKEFPNTVFCTDKTSKEVKQWLSAHDSRLLEAQGKELVERVEGEKEKVKDNWSDPRRLGAHKALSHIQEIIREIIK